MNASSTRHPDPGDFVNFALERLGRKKTQRILEHCKECPECAEKLLATVREHPAGARKMQLSVWNWIAIAVLVLAIIGVFAVVFWILGGLPGTGVLDPEAGVSETMTRVIHTEQPRGWFEDAFTHALVSADGRRLLRIDSLGVRLLDLASGQDRQEELLRDLDTVMGARFDGRGRIARFGNRRRDLGWFLEQDDELRPISIPPDAVPAWAPGNDEIAWTRPPSTLLSLGDPPDHRSFPVEGRILALGWSPLGDAAYALTMSEDGSGTLARVGPLSGEIRTVRADLDASALPNGLAVAADGNTVFVALASAQAPDPEARHDPAAARDMDIYGVDTRSGALRRIFAGPGDDFWPWVAGDSLYWTSNHWQASVVLVPLQEPGGDIPLAVAGALLGEPDAQLPAWSPDGRLLSFTRGGWRLADWGLNLDVYAVPVDELGARAGAVERIIAGYHEDRTPAWSSDGRWLAYRSRRSPGPVPYYAGPGVVDDIFVRRTEAPAASEMRLTDFGWEVGRPDWSADGSRLTFDSWDREGVPRVSRPWIVAFDARAGQATSMERLPLPDGVSGSVSAVWSPVADELLLIERTDPHTQVLWVAAADGSAARRVIEYASSTRSGADWTPDGMSIIYSARAEGRMQLFAVSRNGGEPQRLSAGIADLLHPSVSPDGRWVAATRLEQRKEVRRLALDAIR